MLKTMLNICASILLVFISTLASLGQEATPSATQKPQDDFVTEKGFKSKVFEVKYRDADTLARMLRQLGSGFKGASMSSNSEFKTIVVRDFPENLATIEEALRRLDTPVAPRPNIQLHMHVLVASNTTPPTSTPIPNELKDVITQLRETLSYRNYALAASVIQRLTETPRPLVGQGTAELFDTATNGVSTPTRYEYMINSVSLVPNATGVLTVQIHDFSFTTMGEKERARIETALNLRDGEKVVVGTATLSNRALVIVLTANLVN